MKTCIVTGASSGIGKAVAERLYHSGTVENLVLVGRSEESLADVLSGMSGSFSHVVPVAIDLEKPEEIPVAVARIYERFGKIDGLLNIAGYTDPQSLLSASLESFRKTYTVNVFSVFMLIRECVKFMKRNVPDGGKILNVASTAGITPRPGWLSYASSKAAVIAMSQTLSEELSEYKIKVYCVSPGRCATKLRKRLAPEEDPTTIMQPDEVSEVVCSLISDSGNCLDGQNIVIRKQR